MSNDLHAPSTIRALFSLTGRVALVTGGNSGIGKALAWALASSGARVVMLARREQELDQVVKQFREAGLEIAALSRDLTDRAIYDSIVRDAAAAFGAPDILVNAAGMHARRSFEDQDDGHWDRTIALNLTAPFLLTRALAPAMRDRGWGRILNLSSLQSVRAFPDGVSYGASKGGITQLTRATAEHWSCHGITCNAVAPGYFATPLTATVLGDAAQRAGLAARTMVGRNGELNDLSGAAIFLASNASAYITGQTLFVDGGFSAR